MSLAIVAYPTAVVIGVVALGLGLGFHALASRRETGRTARPRAHGRVAVWFGRVTVLSVLLLGGTAFGAALTTGAMHGYVLMLHTAAGGLLVLALAGFALLGSGAYLTGATGRFAGLAFWLVLLFGLATAGSMIAAMFPILDSDAMQHLLAVHRWSGLGLFLATALSVYAVRRLGP